MYSIMPNVITPIVCTDTCLSAGGTSKVTRRLVANRTPIEAQAYDNRSQFSNASTDSADGSSSSGYLQPNCNNRRSVSIGNKKRFPVFLAFSEADFDLASQVSENIQSTFLQSQIERDMQCIKERVRDLSLDTETFLRVNNQLLAFVKRSFDTIESQIRKTVEPIFSFSLSKYTDKEMPEMEELQLTVRIEVDNHKTLMSLWENSDKELFAQANKEIKSKLNTNFEPL